MITKQQALNIGHKVLNDLKMDYDRTYEDNVKFFEKKTNVIFPVDSFIFFYEYGKEDFGENVGGSISIDAITGIAYNISYRNGFILLEYDENNNKYHISKKR